MNSRPEFAFQALDGSGFLGYLAALGLMSILKKDGPGLRGKWVTNEASPYPVLQVDEGSTRTDIVDRIYAAREWWGEWLDSLPNAMREPFSSLNFNAASYREFAHVSLSAAPQSALAAFAGTENSRLSRKGARRFDRSPYYFFSGQQDLTSTILEIAANVSREDLEKIFDCQPSDIPLRKTKCLRFEPQEVEDHALRMVDPSDDLSPKNVPLNFLASFALPLLYAWPTEHGGEALNHKCVPGGDRLLRWRLWDEWLSLNAALSAQRVIVSQPSAQGVQFSARAVLAVRGQNYYRMLPAKQER